MCHFCGGPPIGPLENDASCLVDPCIRYACRCGGMTTTVRYDLQSLITWWRLNIPGRNRVSCILRLQCEEDGSGHMNLWQSHPQGKGGPVWASVDEIPGGSLEAMARLEAVRSVIEV